jgi:hypothetical protein
MCELTVTTRWSTRQRVYHLEPLPHILQIGITQLEAHPKPLARVEGFHPNGLTNQLEIFLPVLHGYGDIESAAFRYSLCYVDSQTTHRDIDGFASNNRIVGFTPTTSAHHFNKDGLDHLDSLMLASVYIFQRQKIASNEPAFIQEYRNLLFTQLISTLFLS